MIKPKKEKIVAKKEGPAKAKKPVSKALKAPTVKTTPVKRAVKAKPKVSKPAPVGLALSKGKLPVKKIKPVVEPILVKEPKLAIAPLKPAEKEILKPIIKEVKKEIPRPALKQPAKPVLKEAPAFVAKEAPKPHIAKEIPVVKEQKLEVEPQKPVITKELELGLPITVKDLAVKLQEKSSVLIKALMEMRVMAGLNQALDEDTTRKVCEKFGYKIKQAPGKEEIALRKHFEPEGQQNLRPRSPIVTFMGHVDHGKTSLLDAIRKTKVAESEHGGITQHIGAYRVRLSHGEITFLDTPGHEAFTAMRSRGASITDIVVLVVAADDGVMPQTQEAIDHAKAAGVPIIVAMNKVDKPQANIDRVKKQLAELNLTAEDWGGKTITVPVSAKTGQGIDDLLEMILLEAQMLELKADLQRIARGVVIEAKMSKGRGPVSTLLIQNGTLRLNDNVIIDGIYGKVRAMFDDRGRAVTQAEPSCAVEVLGVSSVPEAGEQFFVIEDEKEARQLAMMRHERQKQQQMKTVKRISLEDLHAQIQAGKIKELKLIIKADVQGSLEAIKETLNKLNVSEIKLDIIHTAVGNINSSDVVLAVASNALILGFNVVSDERAKELIAKEGVDARIYNIIYELANDIKAAVEGMLEPKLKKVFLGKAEVRKVFRLSRAGMIAGCFVTKGKINRSGVINLVRNGQLVFEGKLASLKRFKDDVREVLEGFECGISLTGFDQVMEGDVIEAYEIEKIARKL
ncbi:MAG: translation initiation factor IF-2 [Candidatus Omnitrophota bacterium]